MNRWLGSIDKQTFLALRIRVWVSGDQSSGYERHSLAIVVAFSVAAGQVAVAFDEAACGFGSAVVGAAGVPIGQKGVRLLS